MAERSLLLLLLVLLASCVPQAAARTEMPSETAEITGEALRQLPAARIPAVIDTVTAPGSAAAPFEAGAAALGGRALDCLTAAVYYEARSESADGQRAVAQVVLNRVRHPAFPRSVCGVVFQGQHRRTGCQFSFSCDGSMRRSREPGAWARAREIAEAALSGYVFAPVGLATHFHTTAIRPWWAPSMRRAVTVGAHIFYRWPGQWGDPLAFRQPYAGGEGGLPSASPTGSGDVARNTETVMGVTIHRSSGAPAVVAPAQLASAEAAPRPAPRSRSVRVRRDGHTITIHRGGTPPVEVAESAAPGESATAATR